MAASSSSSLQRTPPARPAPIAFSSRIDEHLRLSKQPQSLGDITRDTQLPCVIKCDPVTVTQSMVPLDLSQPLLVYTKRSVRKVAARSVVFNKGQGRYMETGDDILVPEDYIGWFGVLGNSARMQVEGNIPHFRTVNKLAISPCTEFLVAGNTPVRAFTRVSRGSEWIAHEVAPGEVLRKGDLCQTRQELGQKGGKKPKKSSSKSSKGDNTANVYLRCYDDKDREILMHGTTEGVFYILSQFGAPLRTPVQSMRNILQRFKFPLLVKLLYGPIPSTPCAFKDTLLLTESSMNHTVLASTLNNLRNINLEIPLDTEMRFYVAESTQALTQSRQYQQALEECRAKVPIYKRNMKVLFGSVPGDVTLSRGSSSSSSSLPPSPRHPGSRKSSRSEPSPPSPGLSSARTPSGGEPSHHVKLRDTTPIESRMSIISRIVTLNLEDQPIFTPNIPPSPSTLPLQGKQGLNFRTKSSREKDPAPPVTPGSLAAISDFKPPPNPEIISGTRMRREVSEEGMAKLEAFRRQQRQEVGGYETPNSLTERGQESNNVQVKGQYEIPNSLTGQGQSNHETPSNVPVKGQYETPSEIFQRQDDNDYNGDEDNPYGTVWESDSMRGGNSMCRDSTVSVVGIQVDCKAGKPVSPTSDILEKKRTHDELPRSSSHSSATSPTSCSLDPNNNRESSPTDTAEINAQNNLPPSYESSNLPPPPAWLTAPADSVPPTNPAPPDHYHTPHTARVSHVYNELVHSNDNVGPRQTTSTFKDDYMNQSEVTLADNNGYMNQREATLTRDIPPPTQASVYDNDTLLCRVRGRPSVGYTSTPQTNEYASIGEHQGGGSGYEDPSDLWRRNPALPLETNRLAACARGLNSDSGIYDGDDVSSSSLPLEDPYDCPAPETGQLYVHSTPVSQPSSSVYATVIEPGQPPAVRPNTLNPCSPSLPYNPHNLSNTTNPPNPLKALNTSNPLNPPNSSSLMEEVYRNLPGGQSGTELQAQPMPPDGTCSDPPYVSPSGPQEEDRPPVPLNHPPKAVNIKSTLEMLGRVKVQAQAPAKSRKDALLGELKQVGIKPSSELALSTLQAADFALLAQTDEDKLDDVLLSLLPSIGQIDLRKISMCIKSMGIFLDSN